MVNGQLKTRCDAAAFGVDLIDGSWHIQTVPRESPVKVTAMDFDSILGAIANSAQAASKLIAEAMRKEYDRGFADGRQKAAEELRARVASALEGSDTVKIAGVVTGQVARAPVEAIRAPRGSVEPKVFGSLRDSIKGKKPAEIAAETGVPENSVRGMLNKLRKENRVFKVGNVWRPTAPIPQPDGSTVRVTPDGLLISTPANLVGKGNPGAGAPGPINKPT
jgi:hypothetical protein